MNRLDDELVMLSALQHYLFCPRQCALIHVEGQWSENFLTASGRVLHERVDRMGAETRRDVHVATSLRLVSKRLGVMGVADLVEFHRVAGEGGAACTLPGRTGLWRPCPVEYKRGKPKAHRADEVQLCAQALCLEEMLGVQISEGALFYGEPRRRTVVSFDVALRTLTETVISAVHDLIAKGETPSPRVSKGCDACSMKELCRPEDCGNGLSVKRWLANQIAEVMP